MRAVIVEEWAILRHGMAVVLRQGGGARSVTEATTVTEAVSAVQASAPDLVVIGSVPDAAMPGSVARLAAEAPCADLVALVDAGGAEVLGATLAAGAHAVLPRSADADELLDAVARVRRGERVLGSELVSVLARAATTPAEPAVVAHVAGLTRREHEILVHLAQGSSNREIATALYIGEATVKTHLASIYDKLGVANRHQAVARAIELGAFVAAARPAPGAAAVAAS